MAIRKIVELSSKNLRLLDLVYRGSRSIGRFSYCGYVQIGCVGGKELIG